MAVDVGSNAPDFTLRIRIVNRSPSAPAGQAGGAGVLSGRVQLGLHQRAVHLPRLAGRAQRGQRSGVRDQRRHVLRLKAFQDQQKLKFPLLSDFNKQVIREYGVFNEDMIGLKGIAKRAVFVLDKDGIVRHREVLEDARNEPDYDKVFATLASLG